MANQQTNKESNVRDEVRRKYAEIASSVRDRSGGEKGSCCGPSCCESEAEKENPITSNLYPTDDVAGLPDEAVQASLGCGNPTLLAELHEGETVLDLGSGGGIDVLLSARRVGPTGKAYGLDMTDEMLALARENQHKAGVKNVEFLKGHIESIPLPDNSVDVIISNCVINLSTDKPKVFAEAIRVLKPGGRFAVSDVVAGEPVPDVIRRNMELWAGCIAGTLEALEYRSLLEEAGFDAIEIEPTRIYRVSELGDKLESTGLSSEEIAQADGKFMSAFIRAQKPS
jgi:SAM-dependent methyltransferase